MMKTPVSILSITMVCIMSAFPSNGAQMTSQIRELLDQKEEKIKKLEECDGKRKGWMIAGISTIGLTAVGVGVNIAQANKSNKLSGEIEQSKQELERQQERLSRIEGQISKKEQEAKAERERAEREKAEREKAETKIDHNDYKDREPDGKIGDPCDDGRGTWVVGIDDTNKVCLDANGNGLQPCHCEAKKDNADKTDPAKKPGDTGPKEKKETSLQKCLRERSGDLEGTACCYLSKSVAEYVDGKCECKGDKEFSIGSDGRGKCDAVGSDVKPNIDTSRSTTKTDETNSSSSKTNTSNVSVPLTKTSEINSSSATGEKGTCIIDTPNTSLPEGCTCDASKGLVERYVTTIGGSRGKNKECKCDSGTWWNGQECLETQTVRSATSKSVSKNSESTSLSTSTSNSGSSSSSNTGNNSTSAATGGSANSKSVKTNNGGKGSSSVDKTGEKAGISSGSSSSSNTGNNSTSATTGVNTGSSSTSVQGDCIIEKPNTTLPEGCVCDASKGLVERYLTTMGGKRSKNKECKCDSGTRWDGRENMCI